MSSMSPAAHHSIRQTYYSNRLDTSSVFLTKVPLCSIFYIPKSRNPDPEQTEPNTAWTTKNHRHFFKSFWLPTGFWPPWPWPYAIRSQPTKSCAALTCDSSNGLKVIAERNVGGSWRVLFGCCFLGGDGYEKNVVSLNTNWGLGRFRWDLF